MSMKISNACIGCTACTKVCPVGAISGERKSLHVIDDQLCIECGSCGRVCPSGAVQDASGKTISRVPRRADWPKPQFDLAKCISCAACADRCPVACISMGLGHTGGLEAWPKLSSPDACVSCGLCAFYCPADCIVLITPAATGVRA